MRSFFVGSSALVAHPSGSAIHRDERTDNFARLKMASSIWVSLDYTSQLRGADWNSGPLHPTKPSPPCPKTIRWRAKHGRAKSSRVHVFHRNVRSELSLLSQVANQDLSPRGFYAEGFAGCRS